MSRCEDYIWRPGVTPLRTILLSASSLFFSDHLCNGHQLPQSGKDQAGKMGRGLGFQFQLSHKMILCSLTGCHFPHLQVKELKQMIP